MPTIGDMEYGYDANGVSQYLDNIKSEALQQAKDAVLDTTVLVNACESNWEGKARENFVTNLNKDAQHVGDQFDALYNVLCSEINSLSEAYADKDGQLIQS